MEVVFINISTIVLSFWLWTLFVLSQINLNDPIIRDPPFRDKAEILAGCDQGDQIGRIFAQRLIVFFGQILKNNRNRPHFWATSFRG
jgi:hypothetical protein